MCKTFGEVVKVKHSGCLFQIYKKQPISDEKDPNGDKLTAIRI